MNKFSDLNPYEPPIQAELSRPHYQPPRPKRWTPYGSFVFTVFGPVAFIVIMRFVIREFGILVVQDEDQDRPSVEFWAIFATTAAVWLVAAIRSLIWLLAYSWR